MKLFKKVLAGVAMAAAVASAQASPITVAGVTWDPDSSIDFSAASVSIRQFIDGTTGEVTGFGTINTINGASGFCSGCELTFQFGGFTPISGFLPTTVGSQVLYTGGFVNVYVDDTPEAINAVSTTMTSASTGDGKKWLELSGHEFDGQITFTGNVLGAGSYVTALSGFGALDVVGGLAKGNFDTNTQLDGSDLFFSNSFTTFANGSLLNATGTGNFNGNSIPEPTSLALLGLGLLGVAAARRKSAK